MLFFHLSKGDGNLCALSRYTVNFNSSVSERRAGNSFVHIADTEMLFVINGFVFLMYFSALPAVRIQYQFHYHRW